MMVEEVLMKFSNEIKVVVPARSGSKSIKHKNIKKLTKTFVTHTYYCKKIKKISNIIASSDSKKYINIAKNMEILLLIKDQ